jgi:hypothetical protein
MILEHGDRWTIEWPREKRLDDWVEYLWKLHDHAEKASPGSGFSGEQATLQSLELKSQTAIGSLQVVQVSNEIALAQVQQVQMLRQSSWPRLNSQNVNAANQVNNRSRRVSKLRQCSRHLYPVEFKICCR